MLYRKESDRIVVYDKEDFNPLHIVRCGQLFRYNESKDFIEIFAGKFRSILKRENDCVIIDTNEVDYFENYFDLSTDYAEVRKNLAKFGIEESLFFGKGLRILKQDPEETVFSFIVSANNNIPRIRGILERLCERYGELREGYRAFPKAEALKDASESELRAIGLGYRAPYLIETVKAICGGFDLNLYETDTDEARAKLMTLSGVGSKVADCILLFAYAKRDVFPVDTWVKRIYKDVIGDSDEKTDSMARKLRKKFGEISGYAQQYLFYYYRNKVLQTMTEEIVL